ncbi:MAG: hypothetical protein ACPGWR_31485 [Ardenticatenaceae bacterium]
MIGDVWSCLVIFGHSLGMFGSMVAQWLLIDGRGLPARLAPTDHGVFNVFLLCFHGIVGAMFGDLWS